MVRALVIQVNDIWHTSPSTSTTTNEKYQQ